VQRKKLEVRVNCKRIASLLANIVFALALFSAPLLAHHGGALYETTKTSTMKGTVTQWIWANPHCFLKFDVKDATGNVTHWAGEVANPSDMTNRGWSKESFKAGEEVTVVLYPVKNGAPVGRLVQVELSSGQILKALNTPAPVASDSSK
jgi:hypothetical protein